MNWLKILLLTLVALGGLGFITGIVFAGVFTIKRVPNRMPVFAIQAITGIGGVLATNLGAVLGLAFAESETSAVGLRPWEFSTEALPVSAAYLYILGLALALVFWGTKGFKYDPAKVVSTLPQLSQTLLGVLVGALAVGLGVAQG